jgi:predicted NUDIX family phosphoesterase
MSGGSVEMVYAVPRARLMDERGWRGVRRDGSPNPIFEVIAGYGAFFPRLEAEADGSIKQIIPYLVLRDGERVFLMQRTRAGGDARLHDRFTIGVGGHMNPGDGSVVATLEREWREELVTDFVPEFEYVGLLNDDEVEVGRHHLGIVFQADAAGRPVAIREIDKLSGSFESLATARAVYDRMETWSQLVLDALSDRTFGPVGESQP